MLKAGDKVRVREDLIVGSNYGGEMFCGGYMESLKGRIATIVEVYDCLSYDIDIDEDGWMWTEEMFEIIEKEVSVNMKELTFREVIANIKEGEVWEGGNKIIKCTEVAICIETTDGVAYNGFGFLDKSLYRLQRPQYTFQEAFKAFEEGKEIESCESGYIYNTTEENVEDKIFYGYEIQGKWYIND